MAKFNEIQKKRRAILSQRKRAIHGDPLTGKLKVKPQSVSISGKRKRKNLKQWRREQKEALEKGLITMEDVEMAVAEADSNKQTEKPSTTAQLRMKKRLKIKAMQSNNKGGSKKKGKNKGKQVAEAQMDIMIE